MSSASRTRLKLSRCRDRHLFDTIGRLLCQESPVFDEEDFNAVLDKVPVLNISLTALLLAEWPFARAMSTS